MKNRSVQAISIGLSAISLAGPVSMTVYAQTAEATEDAENAAEQQVFSDSEEKAIAEEVSVLSEQLNTSASTKKLAESASASDEQYQQQVSDILEDESTAQEAVGSVGVSTDNIVKAEMAIDEATQQAEEATAQAGDAIESTTPVISDACTKAGEAVNVLMDENTEESDAAVIIADTEKTVDEAQETFETAENKYSDALSAYNSAKDDFDTALAAYNSNLDNAMSGLEEADGALASAQQRLEELQKQVEEAKNELAAAGAEALIAADDNKNTSTDSYVQAVLQYYYIPNTEKLSEGQRIENLVITPSDTNPGLFNVSYDIVEVASEEGSEEKVLRTVNANYGYTLDGEDGEVQLFTKELTYQYKNSDGEIITISKEEAEALNGEVEIDKYWTISGYYVPVYRDYMLYKGTRPWPKTSSKALAIASGMKYVVDLYKNNVDIYKASIDFDDDWKAKFVLIGLEYQTSGHFTALYNKISDLPGYTVSKDIAEARYVTEEEAVAAVIEQAKADQGAYSIDADDSNLVARQYAEYSKIVEKYINVGEAVWKSTSSDYMAHTSNIRAKVTAYKNLLSSVESARADFEAAQEKVAAIKSKLENLNGATDIISVVEMARLDVQLKKAETDYSEAKENLVSAKTSLAKAKELFESRYNNADAPTPGDPQAAPAEEAPEEQASEEEQVPKEEKAPEDKKTSIEEKEDKHNDEDNSSNGIAYVSASTGTTNVISMAEPEVPEELEEDAQEPSIIVDNYDDGNGDAGADTQEESDLPIDVPLNPEEVVTIEEEPTPLAITMTGLVQHVKWFAGLAGVSAAGAGVTVFEIKRRAAAKIIDKLNQ